MREMGTESPVIWPAWCYSGETGGDGDIPSQSMTSSGASGVSITKSGTKRSSTASTPLPVNNDTTKLITNGASDFQHNNNNSIKNERLSPASYTATPDNSSRSRSVTPSSSSVPGTPPGTEHTAATLSGRNYSDIMRSLAAKYNNNNPNEYFNPLIRNGLLDSRGFAQNFKSKTIYSNPLSPVASNNSSLHTTINNNSSVLNINTNSMKDLVNNCDSSPNKKPDLFSTGANNLPIFPAMIDMSSTQALLALVQQAKQDELHKCLKRSAPAPTSLVSSETINVSPLDLSSAGTIPVIATKRNRTSAKLTSNKRSESESPEPTSAVPTPPITASTASSILTTASTTKNTITTTPCLTSHQICVGQCATNVEIFSWTVDDVVNFVSSIDICAEYAENFREQRIDGAGLPLLTEEHLTQTMHMKLGPALKLKASIYKKMGSCALCFHCVHCHKSAAQTSSSSNDSTINQTILKHEKQRLANNSSS